MCAALLGIQRYTSTYMLYNKHYYLHLSKERDIPKPLCSFWYLHILSTWYDGNWVINERIDKLRKHYFVDKMVKNGCKWEGTQIQLYCQNTRLHIIALHCSKQHFEPNLIKRESGIEHEFRKTWHDALKINLSIY